MFADLRELRLTSHIIGTSDMPFTAHPRDLPYIPDADGSLRENGVAMALKREEGVWQKSAGTALPRLRKSFACAERDLYSLWPWRSVTSKLSPTRNTAVRVRPKRILTA